MDHGHELKDQSDGPCQDELKDPCLAGPQQCSGSQQCPAKVSTPLPCGKASSAEKGPLDPAGEGSLDEAGEELPPGGGDED